MNKPHKGIWIAYILSIFTPLTCLISGVVAIVYAGYRLDKGQDGEVDSVLAVFGSKGVPVTLTVQ